MSAQSTPVGKTSKPPLTDSVDPTPPVLAPLVALCDEHGWRAGVQWGTARLYSRVVFPDENLADQFAWGVADGISGLGRRHPPETRSRWQMEMLAHLGLQESRP